MPRYVFMVMTHPAEGREAEYNQWYDEVHLADVVKVPGFVSAQRFVLVQGADLPTAPRRYLALYEMETDDLAAANRALKQAAGTAAMPISEALDRSSVTCGYFQEIGAPVLAQAK